MFTGTPPTNTGFIISNVNKYNNNAFFLNVFLNC